MIQAGGFRGFKHKSWNEFHTGYGVLHPTEVAHQKTCLTENSKLLEKKYGLYNVIVYNLHETKVGQLMPSKLSFLGIPL